MSTIPTQAQLEAEYKLFTDSIEAYFSSPAQKPASELGGSGAGLVGNPPPIITWVGITSKGWAAGTFNLAQFARCRDELLNGIGLEVCSVRLEGSLV